MAVPSSSQCCQAVRRHLRPQYDGVWVPDSLLASAFERYAATFRTGARHGSSVPGPMEHRKRLAKRHMGELRLGQSHSAAPLWEIANLVDLTQWQWKPPTSAHGRRPPPTTSSPETPTLWDAMLGELRSFFPPRTDAADDLRGRDGLLLPPDVILRGVAEPSPPAAWHIEMGATPLDVIHAALEALSHEKLDGTGAPSLFSGFCHKWRQALARGLFRAEAIGEVLTGVSDGLDSQPIDFWDSKRADRLKLLLIEATIEGISSGGAGQTAPFDHVAWNSVLDRVSAIRMNTIRLFTKAIACIPEQSLKEVSPGILGNIDTFLNALGRATVLSTVLRQTAKMAVPLESLGQPELRFLLDDATKKVLGYAHADGVYYEHVRLSWLLLLARIPGVDEGYLGRVCIALEAGPVDRPLTDSDVCRLFLVYANSQAPIEQYATICKSLKHNGARCYRSLTANLWRTGQCYRVQHFSEFLHAVGRENNVTLLAKGAANSCPPSPRSLAGVAIRMRRPRAAIDLLCLYEESRRRKLSFWGSTYGLKALMILTWVPNFDYSGLWKALHIIPDEHFRLRLRRRRRRLKGLDQNNIVKLATVGVVTGLSPYLSERRVFSLMTECYLNIQRHNTKLPRYFLSAFVEHVTQPLTNGEPGITARLLYALNIIQKQMGRAEAVRIAKAMERRRKYNFESKEVSKWRE